MIDRDMLDIYLADIFTDTIHFQGANSLRRGRIAQVSSVFTR